MYLMLVFRALIAFRMDEFRTLVDLVDDKIHKCCKLKEDSMEGSKLWFIGVLEEISGNPVLEH
jgi:hypothetical protein